jgi:hypothetical protein
MVHLLRARLAIRTTENATMPFDTPFILGPFLVDAEGRLAPRSPDVPPAFVIRWRDRPVRARMVQTQPDDGRLWLQATLGRVPSTVSDAGGAARPQSFALLRGLKRVLPAAWRLRLLPDHRAMLETEARIALPITATGLLTEVTLFLLSLAPYLDLLDEAGFPTALALNHDPAR